MMQEHYCGNWYNCDADILDFLTESGVRVMWKVNDERWKVLSSEDEIKRVVRPSTSPYKEEPNVWVSYRIPSERYPLLKAQLRQKQREEDAEIDARMRAEYEEWLAGQQSDDDLKGIDMESECIGGYIYDHQIAPERCF